MALFGGRFLGFKSDKRRKMGRLGELASNQLGVISQFRPAFPIESIRSPKLELLDAYYEARQYAGFDPWDQMDPKAPYVPIRRRAPRIQFNFGKLISSRLASKLVGAQTFPELKVEDDPDTEEYLKMIVKASKLKARIVEPIRRELAAGSVFIRFKIEGGTFQIEHFLSKFVTPKFQANGELESARIQFVFEDNDDKDELGNPKKKWFRLDITQVSDIKWLPVDFEEGSEPEFEKIEEQVDHEMGFVQGEWLRTMEVPNSPDGPSVIEDILGFIDELNYNLSQSSTAVQFNQDPQLVVKGMNEEELGALIRSSQKAWNLGREGEAQFLESTLNGATHALEFRDKLRLSVQDIARVILMDPEKIVGHAQSAKAMEVLHAPMMDLIGELRPAIGDSLQKLILKMGIANIIVFNRFSEAAPVQVPPGYRPQSLDVTMSWPPVFPLTMQDLQQKISMVSAATSASIISRETGLAFVAKDFGVENLEEEKAKIDAQPIINPFGAF